MTTWFFISNWVKNDLYNANFKKQKRGVHDIHQGYHVLNFEGRTSITTTCRHTNRKRYAFLNGNYEFFPTSSYSLVAAQRLCLAATRMRERTSEHRISAYGAASLTEFNHLSPIHAFLIPDHLMLRQVDKWGMLRQVGDGNRRLDENWPKPPHLNWDEKIEKKLSDPHKKYISCRNGEITHRHEEK